jgi:hypothetical protein
VLVEGSGYMKKAFQGKKVLKEAEAAFAIVL